MYLMYSRFKNNSENKKKKLLNWRNCKLTLFLYKIVSTVPEQIKNLYVKKTLLYLTSKFCLKLAQLILLYRYIIWGNSIEIKKKL